MKTAKFKRIQSVDRALDILEAVGEGGCATVGEIAAKVSLNASTAYNIVKTLEARGFIANEDGAYGVGPKLGLLASDWRLSEKLPSLGKPILDEVNEKTGEAVCVTILSGAHAEIVRLMPGTRQVSAQFLHRTWKYPLNLGTGRLLIALGDPADWPRHIKRHLDEGPKNLDEREWDAQKWRAHLERVKEKDCVVLRIKPGDGEEPIGAVAVPLRTSRGALLGAIGCSCPLNRATKEHLQLIESAILSAIENNPI